MLPNLTLLKQIHQRIQTIPNNHGEYKRKTHYGLFLLCQKAGLRVSEAVNFNLAEKTQNGLYRIEKPKGQKERFVYIPKAVIKELKKHHWKPKQTNRFNFFHFLRRIKKGLEIPNHIELTPHTLRRSFATYHAEAGLPLPLLQKLLGHQNIRTTALYWRNIYNDDNGDDTADILTGKQWLEKPKKPQPEPDNSIKVNLEELPELPAPNSLASKQPPNYLSKIQHLENQLSQIQSENNNLKSENSDLRQDLSALNEQNTILATEKNQLQQQLTAKDQTIKGLEQDLIATVTNLTHEKQISNSQNQTITNLRQQLRHEREINADLTQKIYVYEQNYSNLQNAYQNAIRDKEATQKQLNYLVSEIKKAAQQFHQWQKLNHYQQWEKQNELKAQILQPNPPPWKKI